MDTLPTGFILVVLPAAWLVVQFLCWWVLYRFLPLHAPLNGPDNRASIPADVAFLSPIPLTRRHS